MTTDRPHTDPDPRSGIDLGPVADPVPALGQGDHRSDGRADRASPPSAPPWLGRRWSGPTGLVVPAVLGAVLAAIALAVDLDDSSGSRPAWSYAVAVGAAACLLARRRAPFATLIAVTAGQIALTWTVDSDVALAPAAAVALYTVARHADERIVGLAVSSVAAVLIGVAIALTANERFTFELIGEVAQGFLPIALADGARTRAVWLRNTIATEAETRVQAERLRIARDLHDVVAHGLSTISVQSGVAAHLIDQDPGQAREALEIINETGRTSLEELRAMVGVLRSTDGAELRPVPTDADDVDELIAVARAAGVDLTDDRRGRFPPEAGDAVVVAVHRIVQEALTNVVRHAGPVPATLSIVHHDDRVDVAITNGSTVGAGRPHRQAGLDTTPSTGVGIIGMRERAESLGGSLRAGPTDDGFRVEATIPYQPTSSAPGAR